ncbi:MAG: response regulator [Patescibacteria group bacterium]|jgi:DNA-binding response OmpR family regulator|nr:response regulator [Patescibacteria group bacterium]
MLEKLFSNKKIAKKVLIVEDDALLSKILSQVFLKENFQVAIVDNGLQVMEAVNKFLPDIILLDLIIPGIDGFAVLKQLKADSTTEKIPVVMLSNLGDVGDVKSAKALGADEYFIKSNVEMERIVKYVKNKLKI